MDFDTTSNGNGGGRSSRGSAAGFPYSSGDGRSSRERRGAEGLSGPTFATTGRSRKPADGDEESGDFRIPGGSRKAALVYLALAVWRAGLLDPKELGEVRRREVDEASLQRALYRSSMGEIEHVLGPVLKGKRVLVEGRLTGTARTAIERLGAEVEELRLEDEKRYLDMTPAVFVLAAVAMAARYVSLGLDDQFMYVLAGIGFALMYGLRPFFFKMQRPADD